MHVTFTLMPAAFTSAVSVQVPGFEDNGLLTHCDRLICDFCSSSQCFAFSFLQIPPRDGHPCRSANRSPCRAGSGLSPPSHPVTTTVTGTAPFKALRAMPGAPKKGPPSFDDPRKIKQNIQTNAYAFVYCTLTCRKTILHQSGKSLLLANLQCRR